MFEESTAPDIAFEGSIAEALIFFVAVAIIIAGILSVFYIFYGGISFIFSQGEEDRIQKALSTIRYALVGLLVTIFAFTIIGIVGAVFDMEILAGVRWDNIVQKTQEFLESLGQNSSDPLLDDTSGQNEDLLFQEPSNGQTEEDRL